LVLWDQKEEQQVRFMESKKTVIIGASPNPSRYAYFAAQRLILSGHPIVPVGIKQGIVEGEKILDLRQLPDVTDVDTVTLYLSEKNQKNWEEYILNLKPKRIIFNPGAENPYLYQKAIQEGIEPLNACTLVMLSARTY